MSKKNADVSRHNGQINWDVAAQELEEVAIRCTMGASGIDERFAFNWAESRRVAIPRRRVYHYVVTGTTAAGQMANIIKVTHGDFGNLPPVVDAERTKDERERMAAGWVFPKAAYTAMLHDLCFSLKERAGQVAIYTSKVEWEAITTQPVWALEFIHWLAQYNEHVQEPDRPAGWEWDLWQYTSQGSVAGIEGPVDLSRYRIHSMTPSENQGCLVGFHTQGNSPAVPLAAEYAALGAPIRGCLADEDGGKAIDLEKHGVRFRGTRLQFSEEGEDHDFEGGGSGRLGWPEAKKLRYLAGIEHMLTVRLGIGELNAATHLQLGCNEWDGKTIEEWNATLDLLSRVVDKVNEVSARLMATKGLAHPLRILLPIFNAGTPSTSAPDGKGAYALYQAISEHPIWAKMAAGNHAIGCHEGIAFDQDFKRGANTPVEPGAPVPPDGGTVNFRIDTLLWLLWQKGIQVDYAILEWYDGRHRGQDIEARIDNLIDLDKHLASMGGPWRARCLGYHTFEITSDPGSPWFDQDFTPIWQHPRWKAHYVSVSKRVNGQNGGAEMPNVSDEDFLALGRLGTQASAASVAANNAVAEINGILARYRTGRAWKAGEVAQAVADPLVVYNAPNGSVHDKRAGYTSDINVVEVSADGQWLKVFAAPPLWVRAQDVKLKGT